jgi:hypothetical protein
VTVKRTNPPILNLMSVLARTLDHAGKIGFAQIRPVWSLLPEGDQNTLDGGPSFIVEFKFVEPWFVTQGMGYGTAQVAQIFDHEPTSRSI